jgi:hypothetical protein
MRIVLKLRAVTMAEAPFASAPMVDRILQSRSLTSSTPSAIGFQMNDFRQKLISQDATREPSVLFGTADLSGLYPFATAEFSSATDSGASGIWP